MSLRYRLEVLWWAFLLVLMGATAARYGARGDVGLAWLSLAIAAGLIVVLMVVLQEAVADAVCRALTGQPMPQRNHKGPTP